MNNLFNKKSLQEYTDKNGFIHLSDLPGHEKIISKIQNLQNWTPTKESNPNYPWRDSSSSSDMYISFVEEYVNRIFKNYTGTWVQLSTYKTNTASWNDELSEYVDSRKTILMYISKIGYMQSMYKRYIKIYYIDINGNFEGIDIPVNEISKLAIRFCTDDEISIIKKLLNNSSPLPYIERFLIKDEYKENYDLYLKDAKKYGYKIWKEDMIKMIRGKYVSTDKCGYIYYGKSVDVKFVNVE